MNIGDYVRTEDGVIAKIISRDSIPGSDGKHSFYIFKTDTGLNISEDEINKYNPKIINLIQSDDYVDGCPVFCINYDLGKDEDIVESITISNPFQETKDILYEEDIKSIVTKEQFESVKYNK